jgi:hypothetical protein
MQVSNDGTVTIAIANLDQIPIHGLDFPCYLHSVYRPSFAGWPGLKLDKEFQVLLDFSNEPIRVLLSGRFI